MNIFFITALNIAVLTACSGLTSTHTDPSKGSQSQDSGDGNKKPTESPTQLGDIDLKPYKEKKDLKPENCDQLTKFSQSLLSEFRSLSCDSDLDCKYHVQSEIKESWHSSCNGLVVHIKLDASENAAKLSQLKEITTEMKKCPMEDCGCPKAEYAAMCDQTSKKCALKTNFQN